MNGQELGRAMRAGQQVYGTLIVSPSPRWPRVVKQCGVDFVFIDTEHIAIDRAELSWMCQTYGALGLAPVVRIPSPDPNEATMVLDGGAAGVVAPYVETVEQVQALRGAVKYRPLKGEKLGHVLAGGTCELELAAYIRQHCANNTLIVNIESAAALAALDEILKVPDLDAVLIGPHDLSCSLGVPEQYDHPKFREAVRTIFQKARAAGVGAGIHFSGELELSAAFLREGANFLIHSSDIQLFAKTFTEELAFLRQTVERSPAGGNVAAPAVNI
jgi:2-keto-3-deoxy-L-rhamnonate aldolase RhmA